MRKYLFTMQLSATKEIDNGLFYLLGGYLQKLAQAIILLLLWRSLANQGADLGGFSLEQLLLYTVLSSVFHQQLNIVTVATNSFWEGSIISRYLHPLPVLAQLAAETIGEWIPTLLLYSLPLLLMAPLANIPIVQAFIAHGVPFVISLVLSISLGLAIDFLFAALVIHLKNANYQAFAIRQAVSKLLSGAVIPFALLPWGIGQVLELLPFGSVASAPLLIAVGAGQVTKLLALQLIWNALLWPLAIFAFRQSQERMVSYGG